MSRNNGTMHNKFDKFIQNTIVIDLGYIGNRFTCYNKRENVLTNLVKFVC